MGNCSLNKARLLPKTIAIYDVKSGSGKIRRLENL
jgi:hypothetical protein